jgi:hypothetical protein
MAVDAAAMFAQPAELYAAMYTAVGNHPELFN